VAWSSLFRSCSNRLIANSQSPKKSACSPGLFLEIGAVIGPSSRFSDDVVASLTGLSPASLVGGRFDAMLGKLQLMDVKRNVKSTIKNRYKGEVFMAATIPWLIGTVNNRMVSGLPVEVGSCIVCGLLNG
jgi:hypothetical protein